MIHPQPRLTERQSAPSDAPPPAAVPQTARPPHATPPPAAAPSAPARAGAAAGRAEAVVRELLAEAGVEVCGGRAWDIAVHDARFFRRVLAHGSLGLGESYMDGWWDAPALDQFFFRVLRAGLEKRAPRDLRARLEALKFRLFNLQGRRLSKRVAENHYDLGNDFYRAMLDPRMQNTGAYFREGDDLAAAQERKLELVCRKLQLRPGERVLDLGCGFGGFARYAAERHGCRVTGVNISARQVEFAREHCKGLPVEILLCDYRDATGVYDKVASIGMTEHVGEKNYRSFLRLVRARLKEDGLFLLHTIGKSEREAAVDPWTEKYIFPGGMIPAVTQLSAAIEGLFVLEDWHNFGASYDPTLMAWRENFRRAWPAFRERYGDRFGRMWDYYLSSCAGNFRARAVQLWQLLLSPRGALGGCAPAR